MFIGVPCKLELNNRVFGRAVGGYGSVEGEVVSVGDIIDTLPGETRMSRGDGDGKPLVEVVSYCILSLLH